MNIKVDFDNIVVKEDSNDFNVKVLMLKGEKGDQGDGENNVIEKVQVNGTDLPVTNKTVNVNVPVVDSALSSSSTNPVQNKVINEALGNKVDASTLNNYYEISEVDNLLNNKANSSALDDYYTKNQSFSKNEINSLLDAKANSNDIANTYETIENHNASISTLNSQISSLASGSPLVASSTSEMTDTTKVYVNTTDGEWYYYDGEEWVAGGTYQAAEDSDTVNKLKEDLSYYKTLKITKDRTDFIEHIGSDNIVQDEDIVAGGYYNTNGYNTYASWGYYIVPVIEGDIIHSRYKGNTLGYLGVFENIDGTYKKIDTYVTRHDDNSSFRYWDLTIPSNVKSVIINLSDISTSKQNWLVVTKNADFPSQYEAYNSTWKLDESINSYLPTDWKSKIQDVQNAQGTKFTFAVQTDTHINFAKTNNQNSIYVCNNLKELTSYIGFDFVCNLGDIIEGYTSRSTEDAKSDLTEIMHRYIDGACCPVLFSIGNHDDNEPSTISTEIITNDDLFARVIKPMANTSDKIVLAGKVAYYYVDFDDIRVIVLNTQDGTRAGQFNISSEQISWFTNVALNTNKAIMIMGHSPLVSGIGSNIPTNASSILDAVDTFKNNGGTVIGFFYGHEHAQNNVIVNNINHICFRHTGIRAEVVMVDLDNNTINTIVVGDRSNTTDRSFIF